jgi:hypothetical protein
MKKLLCFRSTCCITRIILHYEEAAQALRGVLEEENVLAELHMVSVSPGEDAETRGLIGSPTVLF